MAKLSIDNINIYKSFKKSSYTIETAIGEFVDNSFNSFIDNQQNKTIIVYWNFDENWLQIIDNGKGISKEKVDNIFKLFVSEKRLGIGLKNAAFFLGNKLTIESKNKDLNFGFKTQLSLDNTNDFAPMFFVEPDNILRSFNSATRITIHSLDKSISKERISDLYFNLSKLFKNYLDKINILVAIKKDDCIYDISEGEMTPVASLNDVKKLRFELPEYNGALTVNLDGIIDVDDKFTIQVKGKAYKLLVDNNITGILISNNVRTIIGSNNLYKPKWFNSSFDRVFVDLSLSNIDVNITKNWFIWDDRVQQLVDNYIFNRIKHLQSKKVIETKSLVNSTRQLREEIDDNIHFETSKLYLTKALQVDQNSISDFEIIKNKLHFTFNCDDGKKISINLSRKKDRNSNDWLQLIPIYQDEIKQEYEYEVVYNVSHPFFRSFEDNKNYSHKMEYFVISYAISETICRLDGLNVVDLKYEISKLLKGFSDDF